MDDKLVIHVEAAPERGGTGISLEMRGRCDTADLLTILLTIGRAAELTADEWLRLAFAGVGGDNAVGGTIREEYSMGGGVRREKEK